MPVVRVIAKQLIRVAPPLLVFTLESGADHQPAHVVLRAILSSTSCVKANEPELHLGHLRRLGW